MDQGNMVAALIVFPNVVFLWTFTFKRAKRLIFIDRSICGI